MKRLLPVMSFIMLLSVVFLSACQKKTVEDIIADRIDALVVVAEQEKVRDFLGFFSETTRVQKRLVKHDVGAFALRYFVTHKNIKLYVNFLEIEPVTTEISNKRVAIANITAKVLLTSGDQTLPKRLGLYEVTGYWQQIDDDWLIQELNWRRLPEEN